MSMLKDKLNEDMKSFMIAKDADKLSTIRLLKSAIQYFEIQKGVGYVASDEDVIGVIGREVKKRRESIELYEKGGRQELADKEKQEIELLQTYLPEQLGEENIRQIVKSAIESTGATSMQDMGKIMGVIMPQVKGKADGNLVNKIVRENLD